MAAGPTLYSDISARVNDIIERSLAVARQTNKLADTVLQMSARGMLVRKVNEYNSITWVAAGEEDDTAAQNFSKDALSSLTPTIYRARVDLTDARLESDFDGELAAAEMELGSSASKHMDQMIADQFASLTGGTIGSSGGTITWGNIADALALLENQNIPAGLPRYCALHPYQWRILLKDNTIAGASVAVAPGYQDRMTTSPNFFSVPAYQGITFIVTNSIDIDSSTDAKGALYVPSAIAVDTRKPFNIRPQRDESAEATELNASMWYACGTWRPAFGVTIYTNAATPS